MTISRRGTAVTAAGIGVLFALAVLVAAARGHSTLAVLLSLNGILATSYFVRHRMRARLIYARRPPAPEHRRPEMTDQR